MILFDYLYYRTYSLYQNKWNEEDPKLYAVGIVSLMQEFNLGALLFLIIYHFDIEIERIYVFLFFIVLFILNMYWYSKLCPYDRLFGKWKNETENVKIFKGVFILLYIMASMILFFKTAIYIGKMAS